ncbi:PPK2 family polyphosphate kinase [Jatrophihabitans endophyticus]|uniref:PPK2 family polyphosphate kinase n=1 Tax=Jatrophihabitans endophyticus TaxID=1206085 RepID=UPI0019F9FBE1|nr:PPK2 family polyphosphate kinase [Jatrophihabitans endophyticus]MBE7186805.1 polyphosphate kinase 2 family protein [Jatrophihabitans endophyticus]
MSKQHPTPPTRPMREALAVPRGPVTLAGYDPSARPGAPVEHNRDLRNDDALLQSLQERLWAESTAGGTRSLLVVMQGIDTAGKGGVSKHALGPLSPVGVEYTGFKAPTQAELRHDFLWRIRKRLPAAGVLGVFDRSHYEDVLIVRVHDLVPQEEWEQRYDVINDFEAELVDSGTTVLKIFLNISFDTQRERLLRRLDRDDKHWKFNEGDIDERACWPQYQVAFDAMLERCNTEHAPWFVVPSDHKKYRNWAVGELLRETLEGMDLHYPQPSLDIPALRARLAPPH